MGEWKFVNSHDGVMVKVDGESDMKLYICGRCGARWDHANNQPQGCGDGTCFPVWRRLSIPTEIERLTPKFVCDRCTYSRGIHHQDCTAGIGLRQLGPISPGYCDRCGNRTENSRFCSAKCEEAELYGRPQAAKNTSK